MKASILPATQKRRLLALADKLDSLPVGQFDYGTFGEVRGRGVPGGVDALKEVSMCGTTACALGWAPSLASAKKLGIKLVTRKYKSDGFIFADFTVNGRYVKPITVAKLLFGISEQMFALLFQPGTTVGGLASPGSFASAHEVATHIRNVVDIKFG